MKKIGKAGMLVLVFVLLTSFGLAQSRFQAGGYFSLGYPQNEFKKNIDDMGLGGSGYFLYRLPNSPLSVGLSFGFLIYGHETREEPFSPTVPEVWVDVTTTNAIMMCHFLMRLQPREGRLRPYIDGLFGFNYLTTDTRVRSQEFLDDDSIASSNQINDLALSFGAGGGLMISAYSVPPRPGRGSPFAIYIDLGIRYLKGGNAEYMREGSVIRESGDVYYDVYESVTDIVTLHMGISFAF